MMESVGDLKFKVGQHAEMKTFEEGFRGAWFKCMIRDIDFEINKIFPEFYDFPDEDITWTKIYEMPKYGNKFRHMIKEQLMVRPPYPEMYLKSQMPLVNSISEVCVIIDGAWKVGDLVDWCKDYCYWSVKVIKVLSDEEVEVELPMPPAGEGGVYEALCKDIRPSLDWSPTNGWTLPPMMQEGESVQLIFPSQQGPMEEVEVEVEVGSPVNASSTTVISLAAREEMKMSEHVTSSDSISTLRVVDDDATLDDIDYSNIDLNIMHQHTLEASVLDLEELVNRIKWLRIVLESNQSKSGL